MSTYYHYPRWPFTRLSVTTADGEHTVHVEIEGCPAGELRCSQDQLVAVVLALTDNESGGNARFLVEHRRTLPDSQQLISEDGDLTTIGELRRGVAP